MDYYVVIYSEPNFSAKTIARFENMQDAELFLLALYREWCDLGVSCIKDRNRFGAVIERIEDGKSVATYNVRHYTHAETAQV